MNQKKVLYVLLLLNLICSASINASSPSTPSPLRPLDPRPIPPTITHTPPVLQKSNPSHSQMSQLYSYEVNYIDSDDEDEVKEEKTNQVMEKSVIWTYYCSQKNRHIRFIIEDMPETPPSCTSPKKRKDLTPDSSACVSHKKQYHTPSQICAIEALLKKSQDTNATSGKNTCRPRTRTF